MSGVDYPEIIQLMVKARLTHRSGFWNIYILTSNTLLTSYRSILIFSYLLSRRNILHKKKSRQKRTEEFRVRFWNQNLLNHILIQHNIMMIYFITDPDIQDMLPKITKKYGIFSTVDNEILIYVNKTLIFVEARVHKLSKTSIRSKKYWKSKTFYLRELFAKTFFDFSNPKTIFPYCYLMCYFLLLFLVS